MQCNLYRDWRAAHPRWRVHFLTLLLTLALILPAMPLRAQESAPVTIRLQAPAQVLVGEVIPLTLQIGAGADLVGGMESLAVFDPLAAEYAGFYPPTTAQSGVGTLIVPDTPAGVAAGFFTCATPECQEVGVALAAMSEAGIASAAPDLLATIEIFPLVAGQLEIRLDNLQVVDRNGRPLPVQLEQASVVVQVGEGGQPYPAPAKPWEVAAQAAEIIPQELVAAADVTADQTINHADVMETALNWQIAHEQLAACANIEPTADLNRDGCVTVADVQLAASQIGAVVPEDDPPLRDPTQLPNQLYLPSVQGNENATGASNSAETASVDAAAALTFVVNVLSDENDANVGDGLCRNGRGECTLRAAIAEANNHSGPDNIHFNIPGSGVKTIQLNSRLPSLWDTSGGTTIDGYTQPGATPNTDARISNASILVEVRGKGESFDGLPITSANNLVRGIAFFDLRRSLWIYGSGAKQNIIIGNFLGTNAPSRFAATVTSTQQAHGINIEQGAQNNRVGGTTPAERNVISGNRRSGVGIWHWPTSNNIVYNNLVGISADGTRRLANRMHGIDMNYGASSNIIGGTASGQRNVVSGNGAQGVEMSHGNGTSFNQIVGNFIGADVTGNAIGAHTKNGGYGIQLKDRVRNNTVARNILANNNRGGMIFDNFGTCCLQDNVIENNRIGIGLNNAALGNNGAGIRVLATRSRIGPGNIIAHNTAGGIVIEGNGSDRNTITQNSIFANTGLGIDLAPIGAVNANDGGDGDSGPNEQLNFPVINSARTNQVSGASCANCRVEIFIATGQAGANGQGRTFVGAATANGSGNFTVAVSGVSTGNFVTATATDANGNTSEFAANVIVQ